MGKDSQKVVATDSLVGKAAGKDFQGPEEAAEKGLIPAIWRDGHQQGLKPH